MGRLSYKHYVIVSDNPPVAEHRRQTAKARAGDLLEQPDVPVVPCPHGQRTFRVRIGLVSPLPTLRQVQPSQLFDDGSGLRCLPTEEHHVLLTHTLLRFQTQCL